MGLWEKKHTKWWCAICGAKYDWKQPNRLLVVQTGDSFEQAKVFKAHAVPQGLCANLIPDELTLRAEEVNTSKALINVNHIVPERWGPPLVDADWCAFCQALYKGIEGEDWEEMFTPTR